MTHDSRSPGQTDMYPEIDPYKHGMLQVDDRNFIYWETAGNPTGKPALLLHGGPGSGSVSRHRRLFDPSRYRLVLFDQRGCGQSKPHASTPDIDLTDNTTANLIADVELLREHLDVQQWLVWGGSWGSTLALAYAEAHAENVSEMILWGVTTGRWAEFDWLFRGGAAIFFPEQWERLRAALPAAENDRDIVEAYRKLLADPDPAIHQRAANAWCSWESATLDWPPSNEPHEMFSDPVFALAFARLVTHYVSHNAWLEDEDLLRGADALANIPGIMINGRFDFQAPIGNAWELKRVWPQAELVVVDDAGHSSGSPALTAALIRASNRFAG